MASSTQHEASDHLKGGEMPDYFTPEEAAAIKRVHRDTIIRGIKSGKIPFSRVGIQYRIPASWVHGIDEESPE